MRRFNGLPNNAINSVRNRDVYGISYIPYMDTSAVPASVISGLSHYIFLYIAI